MTLKSGFRMGQGHLSYTSEFLMCHFLLLIVPEAVSCTVREIHPSTGPKSLYFATPFAFNASDGGVP